MAAAEYYNPASASGAACGHEPPRPQRPQPTTHSSATSLPYPISDAPPPYSAYPDQRPQSQPAPEQRPAQALDKPWPPNHPPTQHQQPGGQYYPPPQSNGWHPQHLAQDSMPQRPSGLSNMYRPEDFGRPYPQPQYPPPQQGGYLPPNAAATPQAYGLDRPRPQSGPPPSRHRPASARRRSESYSRSRSRSRSHSRAHRHHHHQHDQPRPRAQKKKSTGVPSFLGAGGGAIIGDAIFPGLGTLGGALLGGIGGHEYGKQRRSYSDSRPVRRDKHFERDWAGDEHGRGRRRDDR